MKQKLLFICLFVVSLSFAQETKRKLLRGKVMYRNVNVVGANVVNNTTSKGVATNDKGEFEIMVKKDDLVIFSSVQYTIKEVTITDEIIKNNRLVVEVKEKVEQLDETVISPENKEKFIDFQEEQIVKYKDYQFAPDRYSSVRNEALPLQQNFQQANVLGLIELLADAIFKKRKKKKKEKPIHLRTSLTEIRHRFKDDFFTENLKIPKDKINQFLYYCDDQYPPESILSEKNEFQLIEFMVQQSEQFLKSITEKN